MTPKDDDGLCPECKEPRIPTANGSVCPNGHGKIMKPLPVTQPPELPGMSAPPRGQKKVECPNCDGEGYAECCECGQDTECRECDGDGYVFKDIDVDEVQAMAEFIDGVASFLILG